jgi:hypothetical protein
MCWCAQQHVLGGGGPHKEDSQGAVPCTRAVLVAATAAYSACQQSVLEQKLQQATRCAALAATFVRAFSGRRGAGFGTLA